MNFYKSAALALDHLDKYQGSVKGSLAAAGVKASGGEAKRILALVIETLKYKPTLQQLLTTVPILSLEKLNFPSKTPPRTPSSLSLLLVLTHDVLFSHRGIEASDKWPPKQALLRHQARLKAELVRLQLKAGVRRKEDLAKTASEGMARYVRWNPNVDLHRAEDWSIGALFEHLGEKGFEKTEKPVYPVPEGKFFLDPHLPDCLLVFPPTSKWWVGDKWYESGAVILQDKASCFPAKVLMEGWVEGEGECIDGTYISALMRHSSHLLAFERSPARFKTLEEMIAKADCRNVRTRRADFTDSDPNDAEFANITRILLDPSCSGSGIVNRLDYLLEDEVDEPDVQSSRLEKLAAFQLQMILHAFRFPSANRIVYSTCSIHAEEDERVVLRALSSSLAKERGWTLAERREVLPAWPRRGRAEEMGGDQRLADSVIRCLPGEDNTNGFFVACFVRGDAQSNWSAKTRKQTKRKRGRAEDGDEKDQLDEGTPIEKGEGDDEERAGSKAARRQQQEKAGGDGEQAEAEGGKAKTAAQAERARRKRVAQKAKRKKLAEE